MSPLLSAHGLEMLEYLPYYYRDTKLTHELLEVSGREFDDLRAAMDRFLNNQFVRTTDEAGIEKWEDELGLAPEPAFTLSERQDRAVSRLRGYGTVTILVVKRVAESYVYGSVEVRDVHDPALPDYTVEIEFIDQTGIPSNLSDLQAAIRVVVPSHLEIFYIYNWLTWAEIDSINAGAPRTWDQWDTADGGGPYTWDEMEVLA